MWCRVFWVGNNRIAFGRTERNELVLIPKCIELRNVQIGDIVAFDKEMARPDSNGYHKESAKYYAKKPHVMARKLTNEERMACPKPETRQHVTADNAVAWKQEQDRAADVDGLREIHAVAGNT